jgi:hypothetical protein
MHRSAAGEVSGPCSATSRIPCRRSSYVIPPPHWEAEQAERERVAARELQEKLEPHPNAVTRRLPGRGNAHLSRSRAPTGC